MTTDNNDLSWLDEVPQDDGWMDPRSTPFEKFPIELLPVPVRSFVVSQARSMRCEEASVALPALSALAAAIGATRRIRLKRNWIEPAVLWTAVISDRSVRPDQPIQVSVEPLVQRQEQSYRELPLKRGKYIPVRNDYREKYRNYFGTAPVEPEPLEPVADRYVSYDGTMRTLVPILSRQPRGMLVCTTDLEGWMGRSPRGRTGIELAHWLEAYQGRALQVDRPKGQDLHVPDACVSLTGVIPAEALWQRLTKSRMACPLFSRLLLAGPAPRSRQWADEEVTAEEQAGYAAVIHKLAGLKFAGQDGPQEKLAPEIVEVTEEAKILLAVFLDGLNLEFRDADDVLAASLGHLEAYAGRLALIVHLSRWAAGENVDPALCDPISMERGTKLARWFATESRRLHTVLRIQQLERQSRLLVAWLQGRDFLAKPRDLCRAFSGQYPTCQSAETALDELVQHGAGEWLAVPPGERGGRPTRIFRLFGAEEAQCRKTIQATLSSAERVLSETASILPSSSTVPDQVWSRGDEFSPRRRQLAAAMSGDDPAVDDPSEVLPEVLSENPPLNPRLNPLASSATGPSEVLSGGRNVDAMNDPDRAKDRQVLSDDSANTEPQKTPPEVLSEDDKPSSKSPWRFGVPEDVLSDRFRQGANVPPALRGKLPSEIERFFDDVEAEQQRLSDFENELHSPGPKDHAAFKERLEGFVRRRKDIRQRMKELGLSLWLHHFPDINGSAQHPERNGH